MMVSLYVCWQVYVRHGLLDGPNFAMFAFGSMEVGEETSGPHDHG